MGGSSSAAESTAAIGVVKVQNNAHQLRRRGISCVVGRYARHSTHRDCWYLGARWKWATTGLIKLYLHSQSVMNLCHLVVYNL